MGIFKQRWHPNVHQFLGLVILFLLAVSSVVVYESAGRTTEVTFDNALAEYRTRGGDPVEPVAAAPTPAGQPPEPATAPAPAPAEQQEPAEAPRAEPDPAALAEPAEPAEAPTAFLPPAQGVYQYRGEGREWLSMPGADRRYPSESFATVRQQGDCRWEFEHGVAREHEDRRVYCSQPGELLFIEGETRVEFFGQSDGTTITCDPPAVVVRSDDRPGITHSSTCGGEGTQTDETTTYLGRSDLVVGGVTVSAHHVRFEAEISGRATGTSKAEVWLHPDSGLLLRVERRTDSRTNAFGGSVRYQEEATFELVDLQPRR